MRRKDLRLIALPPLLPLEEDPEAIAPLPLPAAEPAGAPSRRPVPQSEAMASMTRSAARQETDIRPKAMWERTAAIAALVAETDARLRALSAGAVYPLEAYDRFRRDHPLRPPPLLPAVTAPIAILVDATRAAPFLIRETLRSLQEQTVSDWQAIVVAPLAIRGHPVASFADIEPRITFVDEDAFALPDAERVLVLAAGTALDPTALAWLAFAAERCDADLVFGDHDHGMVDVDAGPLRADPWFYGALDRTMLGWVPAPAAMLATRTLAARADLAWDGGEGLVRGLIAAADAPCRAPHVPRLLATRLELPLSAREARDETLDGVPGRLAPAADRLQPPLPDPREGRIAVVIPTRDGADLLERAIETMRTQARDPARVEVIVVDNRSAEAETLALLDRLEAAGSARRHVFDKPFNWGLASNEGARVSEAEVIVFANNDLEMLSPGWDDVLLEALADRAVGGVGARLLYPNGTVQHGGIVFGMVPGHTEHEGRGIAAADPGPNRRLVVPRDVGGVTGAFLAVRRADFEAVDGIDTAMQVAHSDIDLCLKLRERGLTIRYEPRIEAIHYESITRGFNSTKAQVAFDESERADLVRRWGRASMVEDVGVSPYWSRTGTPFETIRDPSMVEVVRHIDRSGRPHPWLPERREAAEAAAWRPEALI